MFQISDSSSDLCLGLDFYNNFLHCEFNTQYLSTRRTSLIHAYSKLLITTSGVQACTDEHSMLLCAFIVVQENVPRGSSSTFCKGIAERVSQDNVLRACNEVRDIWHKVRSTLSR